MTIYYKNHSYSDDTVAVTTYCWQSFYYLENGIVWLYQNGRVSNKGKLPDFIEKVKRGELNAILVGKYAE